MTSTNLLWVTGVIFVFLAIFVALLVAAEIGEKFRRKGN